MAAPKTVTLADDVYDRMQQEAEVRRPKGALRILTAGASRAVTSRQVG
jgi:hypothetical protein